MWLQKDKNYSMHTDETVCLLYLKPISHNNVTTLCTCRNLIYINWKDKWRNGFLRDDKTYWTKWQNTNGLSSSPPLCSFSGLGNILQAGECRDAVTGMVQVLQHIDDPRRVYQNPFPRINTPGLSRMPQSHPGFHWLWDFFIFRGGSFFFSTKILPPGSFSV